MVEFIDAAFCYISSVIVLLTTVNGIPGVLNNYLSEDGESVLENPEEINSQEEEDLPVEMEADSMLHNCILSMLNTLATNYPQ